METAIKVNREIKTLIVRAVQAVLDDPDFGLKLSDKTKKRLRAAANFRGRTISFSEIKKRHHRSV